jgi:hypothetical protein
MLLAKCIYARQTEGKHVGIVQILRANKNNPSVQWLAIFCWLALSVYQILFKILYFNIPPTDGTKEILDVVNSIYSSELDPLAANLDIEFVI